MLYVLPYGQMSLWGATVITNLLSAIPVFGQDLVELTNITEYLTMATINPVLPTIGTVSIFFLTETRRSQFDLALFIFNNDKKVYDQILAINEIPTIFELPITASGYVDLAFFKNWIVGFTMAEGSFFIKINNDGCFQLKQRVHVLLFEAFKLLFDTRRKIYTEINMYNQFYVSSKTDIQKVINFYSYSRLHPLIS